MYDITRNLSGFIVGKLINRSGLCYGHLVVISHAGKIGGKHKWNCVCKCGQETTVSAGSLQTGNTTSCGCALKERLDKRVDLTNQQFGRLIVLERSKKVSSGFSWLCRCTCGVEKSISASNLKSGISKSCGCLQDEVRKKHGFATGKINHKEYREFLWNEDPSRKIKHYISNRIRRFLHGGKEGGKTFDHLEYTPDDLRLHLESKFESWMNWDNYGTMWHIDHIVPHASFKYTNMEDPVFRECWALSNLRPLKKHENLSRPKWRE